MTPKNLCQRVERAFIFLVILSTNKLVNRGWRGRGQLSQDRKYQIDDDDLIELL